MAWFSEPLSSRDKCLNGFPHRRKSIVGAIALAAFLIRLGAIAWTQSYLIPPDRDHFAFGYESGRIARSLAVGDGFSSPMPFPTGPTAHLAPVYPLLLSRNFQIIRRLYCVVGHRAFVMNSAADALTCVILFYLGSAIFGEIEGLLAAALFALYPTAIWFASGTIWTPPCWRYVLPRSRSVLPAARRSARNAIYRHRSMARIRRTGEIRHLSYRLHGLL